jgi:hypothetical protein
MWKHGGSRGGLPEYATWKSIKQRCNNPKDENYPDYGGRGIKLCDRWNDFAVFLADVGPRPKGHSLDRYPDKDGNYEPGNIRWATQSEQARNKRNNRIVEYCGRSMTVTEASALAGIKFAKVIRRLNRGWTVERALEVIPCA